jgi:hypothetical protein
MIISEMNFCEPSCLRVIVAYSFLPQRLKVTKFHEENNKCETLVNYFSSKNLKIVIKYVAQNPADVTCPLVTGNSPSGAGVAQNPGCWWRHFYSFFET